MSCFEKWNSINIIIRELKKREVARDAEGRTGQASQKLVLAPQPEGGPRVSWAGDFQPSRKMSCLPGRRSICRNLSLKSPCCDPGLRRQGRHVLMRSLFFATSSLIQYIFPNAAYFFLYFYWQAQPPQKNIKRTNKKQSSLVRAFLSNNGWLWKKQKTATEY